MKKNVSVLLIKNQLDQKQIVHTNVAPIFLDQYGSYWEIPCK